MNIEQVATEAAKVADMAVSDTIDAMKALEIYDEDDITPFLVGALKTRLSGQIGGLTWSAKIMRHRKGIAAE